MNNSNWLANVISPIVGAVFGLIAAWIAKKYDARAQAEAALIGIGPTIIEQQNKRIDALMQSLEDLWKREHQCQKELIEIRGKLAQMERHFKIGQ